MVETWHNVSVMINKCKIPSSPPVLVWLRHNNPSLHRADIILASHDTWPGSFIHSYFCLSKEFHLGQQSIEPFYFLSFIISPLGNIIIDKCTDPSGGPPPPPPPLQFQFVCSDWLVLLLLQFAGNLHSSHSELWGPLATLSPLQPGLSEQWQLRWDSDTLRKIQKLQK